MNAEYNHPYILIKGGSLNGVAIPILKPSVSVGRDQDADIVIDDPTVSRKHAEIVHSSDGFVFLDLDSKNGSFVNETKVGRNGQSLKDGDEIRFGPGHAALVFRENRAPEIKAQESRVTESVILREEQPAEPGNVDDADEALQNEVISGSVRLRPVAEQGPYPHVEGGKRISQRDGNYADGIGTHSVGSGTVGDGGCRFDQIR